MKNFITIVGIVFIVWGYQNIIDYGFVEYFLYVFFVWLNVHIIRRLSNASQIRYTLIPIGLFTYWLIYAGLGLIRDAFYVRYLHSGNTIGNDFIVIYLLYILSTICLYLPIKRFIGKPAKGFKFTDRPIHPFTFLFFVSFGLILKVYTITQAGGLENYMFAAYGEKNDSAIMTLINLLSGITQPANAFCMVFMFAKGKPIIRILSIIIFFINMAFGSISGASMSMLAPIISLFIYLFLTHSNTLYRRKLKIVFSALALVGIIGGILIRQNRSDFSSFSYDVLDNAVENVLIEPTFDSATNLRYILNNMHPNYNVDQFIYPYVTMLPRAAFPWKPMPLGRTIGVKMHGGDETTLTAYIPSSIGEFYVDMGYIGVILGMLFVGYVLVYVQRRFNATNFSQFYVIALMGFMGCLGNFAGWYTGAFRGLFLWGLFMYAFIKVNNWLTRRYKRYI